MSPATQDPADLQALLSRWDAAGRTPELFEQLCRDHPSLSDALKSSAQSLARADRLLAIPLHRETSPPPNPPGYRILSLLGEGGMGSVYSAEQLLHNRIVALKFLQASHLASPKALARFEREVELASRLEHPNIASIYDSGAHGSRHYFSMQLIPGHPFDTAAAALPTLAARLDLLITTARALAYAHSRGVIHRDLKPSNILVTVNPDTGNAQPHILDFGLARDATAASLLTHDAAFAGTPAYTSPEQARHEPADVRSDICSLGLMAVQILSGRHPRDLLRPDLLRHIAATPPNLSAALSKSPALSQDLRLILTKSTAFDPADRYQSAEALAADLQAYLENRPLLHARNPTVAYRTRKFLARNKRTVLVSAGTLLLFATAAAYTLTRIQSERTRSAHSAQVAAETNSFLADFLNAADPEMTQGREPTIRSALDRAAARLKTDSAIDPEVASAIHHSIAAAYRKLNFDGVAEPHYRAALAARRSILGPEALPTLETEAELGHNLINLSHFDEGVALLEHAWRSQSRILGEGNSAALVTLIRLTALLDETGHAEEFRAHATRLLDIADHHSIPGSLHGSIELQRLRLATADRNYPKALAISQRLVAEAESTVGPHHTTAIRARMNHGDILREAGHLAESEFILRQVVKDRQALYGPDDTSTLVAELELARTLKAEGRSPETVTLLTHIRAVAESLHFDTPAFRGVDEMIREIEKERR